MGTKRYGELSKIHWGGVKNIQAEIDWADILIFFNAKFDLHWLRRIGVKFQGKRVHDCQLAEFLLENQKNPYPSLDQALEKYGLPLKYDVVKLEYWEKGIDTDDIPRDILTTYLDGDLIKTEQVYDRQMAQFTSTAERKYKLFKLQCQDLFVLEEMEWNGIKFDTTKAKEHADGIVVEVAGLVADIRHYSGDVPLNLNSNDHLSCLLYGGIVEEELRVPIGIYKSGAKVGQTRYKIVVKEYTLPRLLEPLKGTEVLKKDDTKETARYWKTNEDVLRSLKPTKEAAKLLALLKRYTGLEKLRGTYLIGWSNLIDTMHWEKDTIHGNLNQCTVITGRLSSTKPNLQNPDPATKKYCITRYGDE